MFFLSNLMPHSSCKQLPFSAGCYSERYMHVSLQSTLMLPYNRLGTES